VKRALKVNEWAAEKCPVIIFLQKPESKLVPPHGLPRGVEMPFPSGRISFGRPSQSGYLKPHLPIEGMLPSPSFSYRHIQCFSWQCVQRNPA
jgi:hypothetical protein